MCTFLLSEFSPKSGLTEGAKSLSHVPVLLSESSSSKVPAVSALPLGQHKRISPAFSSVPVPNLESPLAVDALQSLIGPLSLPDPAAALSSCARSAALNTRRRNNGLSNSWQTRSNSPGKETSRLMSLVEVSSSPAGLDEASTPHQLNQLSSTGLSSPLSDLDSMNVWPEDFPTYQLDSPVHVLDSPVHLLDSPVHLLDSPVHLLDPPVHRLDSPQKYCMDSVDLQQFELHSPVLTPVPEFTLLSGCQPERSRPNPTLKGKHFPHNLLSNAAMEKTYPLL